MQKQQKQQEQEPKPRLIKFSETRKVQVPGLSPGSIRYEYRAYDVFYIRRKGQRSVVFKSAPQGVYTLAEVQAEWGRG